MIVEKNILLVPEGHSGKSKDPRIYEVRVDSSRDTPAIIQEDVDVETDFVHRAEISDTTKTAFKDARTAGDLQAQLDALYEILTGETLA